MKVSVIMPTYNMDNYVGDAIESWLAQTLVEKELICVDDCSTDGTMDILRQYEKKHVEISVYSTESNQGVGNVRRKAMSLVKGEYVAFLDADDKYLDPGALEMLYDAASQSRSDVAGGLLSSYTEGVVTEYPRFRCLFSSGIPWIDLKYEEFQDDYFFQGFLYRTAFLEKNGIEFPPFRRNEDPPFLARALYFSNNIRAVNVEFYGHREGYKQINYTRESVIDFFDGFLLNMEFADEFHLNILLERTVKRLNGEYLWVLHQGLLLGGSSFLEKLLVANQIAMKYKLHINILEYLFYLYKTSDRLSEFQVVLKLKKLLLKYRKLVLYGAGNIGKIAFSAITVNDFFEIVLWVDHYKNGDIINERRLYDITDINSLDTDYDCILIAIENASISRQIKEELKSQEISENIIIEWSSL